MLLGPFNQLAIMNLERGIHNPKTRKLSTLLTKTGCSHSGFIGVF